MQPLTFRQLRTKLDLRLDDTLNQIFQINLKDEFMLQALTDNYVYIVDNDDTTITVFLQEPYPVPSQFSDVLDMAFDIDGTGYFYSIDPSGYQVINGFIHFTPYYRGLLGGKTLRIIGKRPLGQADLVPVYLQEYLLQLTMLSSYEYLATKLGDNFLTNDITMSDILNLTARCEARIERIRGTLANRWMQRI